MDRRREAKAREGEVKEDEWRVTVNSIFIESSGDDKQRVSSSSRQHPVHLINPTEVRREGVRESEAAPLCHPANHNAQSNCVERTEFRHAETPNQLGQRVSPLL